MQKLCDKIAELRKERGLSYRELASKANGVISANFLCNIELGKWLPKEEKLTRFCKELGLDTVSYLKSLQYSRICK